MVDKRKNITGSQVFSGNGTFFSAVLSLTSATIALAVSFGINISAEEQRSFMEFISALYVVGMGLYLSHKLSGIHEVVNGNTEKRENRVQQLEELIQKEGLEIPPQKSSN